MKNVKELVFDAKYWFLISNNDIRDIGIPDIESLAESLREMTSINLLMLNFG